MTIIETQKWWLLALLLVGGGLCYVLAPILMPFLVASLLAYLGNPLIDFLSRYGMQRSLTVIIVFVFIFAVLILVPVLMLPLVEHQFAVLAQRWPEYVDWLQQNALPRLQALLGNQVSFDISVLKQAFAEHWRLLGGGIAQIFGSVSRSSLMLLSWLANLVVIPVVTFYLLRDWQNLLLGVQRLLPRAWLPVVTQLARDCDEVLAIFLRGQLLVMLCLALVYSVGLWLAGIEFSLLIGLLAGLVSFVPYLGMIIGMGVAGIASYVQFHDLTHLLPVLAVFGVGQLLEGFVLTPWLVGERIGLHPVAVMFAVMAGAQLFGLFGVLLALPIAAVLVVILRYIRQQYLDSSAYTAE
jgi:predicted PurR-regulated permease PerM